MKNKTNYKTILIAVLIILVSGIQIVRAVPSVNILGDYAVVGTSLFATTTANANFTASGTIAFLGLGTSGCLQMTANSVVATTTCAVSNLTFATSGNANIRIASSSPTWTWSQPTSTASVNGYLSSADWTIFNAKQNSLGSSFVSSTACTAPLFCGSVGTVTFSLGITAVSSTRTLTAGDALSGGGNLSADRTFNVVASSGLAISGDGIALNMAGGTCSGTDKISSLSATGTVVCSTDSGGAGGGTSSSSQTFSEVWSPGSFDLPTSTNAAFNKVFGTNIIYTVLDFDSTADESAYRSTVVPSYGSSTMGTSTLSIFWTAGSGTGTFVPTVTYRCVTDDEVWDATTSPDSRNASSSDTLIATGDLHQAVITLTGADFAPRDTCWFRLFRDVSEDTLSADARVFKAILDLQW